VVHYLPSLPSLDHVARELKAHAVAKPDDLGVQLDLVVCNALESVEFLHLLGMIGSELAQPRDRSGHREASGLERRKERGITGERIPARRGFDIGEARKQFLLLEKHLARVRNFLRRLRRAKNRPPRDCADDEHQDRRQKSGGDLGAEREDQSVWHARSTNLLGQYRYRFAKKYQRTTAIRTIATNTTTISVESIMRAAVAVSATAGAGCS
jgi:hypothetical protein